MFPLSPQEVSQTASILKKDGRYNLFLDYYLPFAERFKNSDALKKWLENGQTGETDSAIKEFAASVNRVYEVSTVDSSAAKIAVIEPQSYVTTFRKLREDLQRKPDHPVHRLLKDFYLEELQKNSSFTLLLLDPNRLNLGM
jgi:hypothetical protein